MTTEEAKKFGLQLLHGIMERNESYPVYANNVKQAIDALSEESSSSEIPNDLEEAAHNFALHYDNGTCDGIAQDCFIAGAEWQKKLDDLETADLLTIAHLQGMEQQKAKMMKDAVEGTVVELGETYKDLSISASAKALNQVLQSLGLGDGDKVRVIVIKEGAE